MNLENLRRQLSSRINPKRIVMIEFPTYEKAQEWWHSPEYRAAKELKDKAAISNLVIFQGV